MKFIKLIIKLWNFIFYNQWLEYFSYRPKCQYSWPLIIINVIRPSIKINVFMTDLNSCQSNSRHTSRISYNNYNVRVEVLWSMLIQFTAVYGKINVIFHLLLEHEATTDCESTQFQICIIKTLLDWA